MFTSLCLPSLEKHRPLRMVPRASGDEHEADRPKESVKKATLFERSEFGAFSERRAGCSEADVALELFCILFYVKPKVHDKNYFQTAEQKKKNPFD
ncbi:MAG: hypothetical protein LIP00_12700 [Parabacteroides sp.]|nr:hypothetical protein [Parabacteroides sp.]